MLAVLLMLISLPQPQGRSIGLPNLVNAPKLDISTDACYNATTTRSSQFSQNQPNHHPGSPCDPQPSLAFPSNQQIAQLAFLAWLFELEHPLVSADVLAQPGHDDFLPRALDLCGWLVDGHCTAVTLAGKFGFVSPQR